MTLSPETEKILKLDVVCAVIRKGDRYLACQRSETMREALLWEFPGGKVEMGESLIQALHREIKEELATKVTVRGILRPSVLQQNNKVIYLHPLLCVLEKGEEFALKEHKTFEWVTEQQFDSLEWCPADVDILVRLKDSQIESTLWWR